MSWTAQVLTIFPDMFPGPLGMSLAGKALKDGKWMLETLDIRNFASDKHRSVDDSPSGGGPGMVMRVDILAQAIDEARRSANKNWPLIYLSPRGKKFDQAQARSFAEAGGVTLLCGRFEGVDERLLEARNVIEMSVGDFILSGGEPAALAVIDAVVRLLPDVMGDSETLTEESFEEGLLEYPQYTRPNDWEGLKIPEVLTSGNHKKIATWRRDEAEKLTRHRRPDMWKIYSGRDGSKG
ncbi:MAG: tRNA (guanosine(37)-N1)-methyltransferase TrmD [Sphingomonadales bacterium]